MIYSHEHITIDLSMLKNDADCRMDDFDLAVSQMRGIRAQGVRAVIDQTARGMGRDTAYAQRVAEQSGLRVLHATGYYKEPFLPQECYQMSSEEMRDVLVSELEEGIEDTGICASHIGEIGTGKDGMSEMEQKVFRAACLAHIQTGAPVCTHTTLGTQGLEQVIFFKEYGVDLSRVVLSHVDLSGDLDYMKRLLDTGANIAFDTIGKNNYQPDTGRAQWLTALCRQGYAGQIVLSMDITRRSNCLELGYDYLMTTFIPLLEKEEFKKEWLCAVLETTPARIYGIQEETDAD